VCIPDRLEIWYSGTDDGSSYRACAGRHQLIRVITGPHHRTGGYAKPGALQAIAYREHLSAQPFTHGFTTCCREGHAWPAVTGRIGRFLEKKLAGERGGKLRWRMRYRLCWQAQRRAEQTIAIKNGSAGLETVEPANRDHRCSIHGGYTQQLRPKLRESGRVPMNPRWECEGGPDART